MPSEPDTAKTRIGARCCSGAVFLVGGAAALTRFARDGAPTSRAGRCRAEQFTLLEHIADAMIRATKRRARSPRASPNSCARCWTNGHRRTRAEVIGVLDSIDGSAWSSLAPTFIELPAARRAEVVRMSTRSASRAATRRSRRFKYLVLVGYYQSEIGATRELRYEIVPGAWRSCLPSRKWAAPPQSAGQWRWISTPSSSARESAAAGSRRSCASAASRRW